MSNILLVAACFVLLQTQDGQQPCAISRTGGFDKIYLAQGQIWMTDSGPDAAGYPRLLSLSLGAQRTAYYDNYKVLGEMIPSRWAIADGAILRFANMKTQPPYDAFWIWVDFRSTSETPTGRSMQAPASPDLKDIVHIVADRSERDPVPPLDMHQNLLFAARNLNPQPSYPQNYDFWALNGQSLVLYVQVASRMTVWYFNAKSLGNPGKTIGPHLIAGPSFYGEGEWIQIATYDSPFDGEFLAYWVNGKVHFLTTAGKLFVATGFERPRDPDANRVDIGQSATIDVGGSYIIGTSLPIDGGFRELFLGTCEKRIQVEPVDTPGPVQFGIVDCDYDDVYWVCRDKVFDSTMNKSRTIGTNPVPDNVDGKLREVYKFLPDLVALRKELHPEKGK